MIVKAKVLVKGVSIKDGKDKGGAAKQFLNVHMFALEGRAADIDAGIDASIMEKIQKHVFQPISASLEFFVWDGKPRWSLVGFEPVKA